MKYIINEIKGYMNHMSFDAAVAKVRRNHAGGKEYLISQAAEAIRLAQMTPSQQTKSVGLKSLAQVSEMTGVSRQTLINWHRNKPNLFSVVLYGCLAKQA